MPGALRPTYAVIALAVVLAVGLSGSLAFTEVTGDEFTPEFAMIELDGEDRDLWLYTSRARSFDHQTLAINFVIYGDPGEVRAFLLEGDWEETDEDEQDIAPTETTDALDTGFVQWETAAGANRFVYLTGEHGGIWLAEDYQVHDGDYFGARHHIRAFTYPQEREWVAMQGHYEHWDWFGSRHVVTSVEESQRYLEDDFISQFGSDKVVRIHIGETDRVDFDGWFTLVDLRDEIALVVALLSVVLLGSSISRETPHDIADMLPDNEIGTSVLVVAMVSILLFVRGAGIFLERTMSLTPLAISIPLYPFLFVGLPVCAYLLSRQLDRQWAFAGAAGGFLIAVLLDFSYLGVTHIPLDQLVHRGGLAIALGLIAAGGSKTERKDSGVVDHVQFGVLLWLVAMLLPMFRHTPLPV